MRRLRILTWHVHGNYLYYLSQSNAEFFLPVEAGRNGFGGRGRTFAFGPNVHDVPADQVRDLSVDLVLYQTQTNYVRDRDILSYQQRELPSIYLQHDPPWNHPTNETHWVNDPEVLLVHVTHFNELMWDNSSSPTRVIEHGVLIPRDVTYEGHIPQGIVVINNLASRGRMLGRDIFECVRKQVPLELVGMAASELGGWGEIQPHDLARFEANYRFFFNPIRYTSLGLAVCEAMALGMPIIGLATTEMAATIENGVTGYIGTNVEELIVRMRELLEDHDLARKLGRAAADYARERFCIRRFASAWEDAFEMVVERAIPKRAINVHSPI